MHIPNFSFLPGPSVPGAVFEHAKRKIELVDQLLFHVFIASQHEMERWENDDSLSSDEMKDIIPEEREWQDEIKSQATQLCVVCLYRVVEFTRKALILRLPGSPSARELSSIERVDAVYESHCGQPHRNLMGFAAADELRCLNNCIKHDGFVSKTLACYPGWVIDEPIGRVIAAYYRLAPVVPDYLREFADRLSK